MQTIEALILDIAERLCSRSPRINGLQQNSKNCDAQRLASVCLTLPQNVYADLLYSKCDGGLTNPLHYQKRQTNDERVGVSKLDICLRLTTSAVHHAGVSNSDGDGILGVNI